MGSDERPTNEAENHTVDSADHRPGTAPSGISDLNISDDSLRRLQPAGFWRRFLAWIIDTVIHGMITSPVTFGFPILIFGSLGESASWMTGVTWLFSLVVSFFYFGWFYSHKGATPGKMVMSLKVLNSENGKYIGYGQAFLREFIGKFLSGMIFFVGYIMVGFRTDKKALHDLIFSTQVVHIKE